MRVMKMPMLIDVLDNVQDVFSSRFADFAASLQVHLPLNLTLPTFS
jgi:hypothetical protein